MKKSELEAVKQEVVVVVQYFGTPHFGWYNTNLKSFVLIKNTKVINLLFCLCNIINSAF